MTKKPLQKNGNRGGLPQLDERTPLKTVWLTLYLMAKDGILFPWDQKQGEDV